MNKSLIHFFNWEHKVTYKMHLQNESNMFVIFFSFCRRYYKEMDGLKLDVGVYMKALEVQ